MQVPNVLVSLLHDTILHRYYDTLCDVDQYKTCIFVSYVWTSRFLKNYICNHERNTNLLSNNMNKKPLVIKNPTQCGITCGITSRYPIQAYIVVPGPICVSNTYHESVYTSSSYPSDCNPSLWSGFIINILMDASS